MLSTWAALLPTGVMSFRGDHEPMNDVGPNKHLQWYTVRTYSVGRVPIHEFHEFTKIEEEETGMCTLFYATAAGWHEASSRLISGVFVWQQLTRVLTNSGRPTLHVRPLALVSDNFPCKSKAGKPWEARSPTYYLAKIGSAGLTCSSLIVF